MQEFAVRITYTVIIDGIVHGRPQGRSNSARGLNPPHEKISIGEGLFSPYEGSFWRFSLYVGLFSPLSCPFEDFLDVGGLFLPRKGLFFM